VAEWSREWDQFPLAEKCKALVAAASKKPGEAVSNNFKGVRLHARLIKEGEPNGDGEVWKIGMSVTTKRYPPGWMWEMFIWAWPVIFHKDEMITTSYEKQDLGKRKMLFKEYTLVYRYDIQKIIKEFDETTKKLQSESKSSIPSEAA